jgi:tetratricopeptide (TPR) repeat protein
MRCIDRTEAAVRAIAAAGPALERPGLGGFAQAVSDVPDPDACVLAASLAQRDPPPTGKERETDALGRDLEAAWVRAQLSGAAPDAAGVRALVARAESLAHAPTLARAFQLEGQGLRMSAAYDRADEAVLRAITQAERGHDDQGAAEAWILRVGIAGDRRDLSRVELWLPLAQAAVVRAGDAPQLAAKIANSAGLLSLNKGDLAAAGRELDRALALRLTLAHGEPDVEVARTRSALGHVARLRGDFEAAEQAHREALRVDRLMLGDQHPDVGRDLHNLAGVLRLRGAFEEAQKLYLEALANRTAVFGPSHPEVALTENSLGLIDLEQRKYAAAKTHFERSVAVLEAVQHEDAALPHENLVRTLVALGDAAGALVHADAAQAIELRQRPTHNARLAATLEIAGLAADSLRLRAKARDYRKTALAALGDDDPDLRARLERQLGAAAPVHAAATPPHPAAAASVPSAVAAPPATPSIVAPFPAAPSAPPSALPRRESYGSTQSWN